MRTSGSSSFAGACRSRSHRGPAPAEGRWLGDHRTACATAGVLASRAIPLERGEALERARRCRLVVFGMEVGGRWVPEAATFIRLLAKARAQRRCLPLSGLLPVLRWSGVLAVAAQRAFAASLFELPLGGECSAGGPEPALHELLADAHWQATPAHSRLPMRAV